MNSFGALSLVVNTIPLAKPQMAELGFPADLREVDSASVPEPCKYR